MEVIKRKLQLSKLPVLVVAVLLVAGLVGGYFFYNNYQKSDDKNSTPAGWVEYKNEKYGFGLIYPSTWGVPVFQEGTGDRAQTYTIVFDSIKSKQSTDKHIARISFASNSRACSPSDAGCQRVSLSKASIQKVLAQDNIPFVKFDSSSYATIGSEPIQQVAGVLNVQQIVSIPNLQVESVKAVYSITGNSKDCPSEKLAPSSKKGCITNQIYEELNNVLKSIKGI